MDNSEIVALDVPKQKKIKKPVVTRDKKTIAQNYLALIVVAGAFVGLAVGVKLSESAVTLEWPVLVVATVAVGIWVLDVLRRAIK